MNFSLKSKLILPLLILLIIAVSVVFFLNKELAHAPTVSDAELSEGDSAQDIESDIEALEDDLEDLDSELNALDQDIQDLESEVQAQ